MFWQASFCLMLEQPKEAVTEIKQISINSSWRMCLVIWVTLEHINGKILKITDSSLQTRRTKFNNCVDFEILLQRFLLSLSLSFK